MNQAVVRMSDVVTFVKEFITINDHQDYKRCRVKLHRQGIVLRDVIKGNQIKTKKQQVCKTGQFLVAEIDAKVGGYGIVPPELEGAIVSSHYYLFNVNRDRISVEYLEYYLKTDDFFNQIKPQGSTNYAAIRPNDVLNMIIPLPSIPEQLEIVSRLKYTFESLHSLNIRVKNNDQHIKELRQAILQEAVQGQLVPQDPHDEPARVLLEKIKVEKDQLIKEKKIKKERPLPPISEEEIPYELPRGWEWVRLGEIGSWGAGATPSRGNSDFYGGLIPWLKTGELNDGYIQKSEEYVTELALQKASLRLNKPGDILIAMYGATIGKLGILEIEATTNQACCACTPFSGIYNKYLFNFLLSQREEYKKLGSGGAQPNISKEKIVFSLFPLPPLNEQKRIVEKVDQLMALCDELEKTVEKTKQESEKLMQAVLEEAFSKPKKANSIVEFPTSVLQEAEEEWDMVARAEGISPETQAEIAATLEEIKRERQ